MRRTPPMSELCETFDGTFEKLGAGAARAER
jgi:hypothetical protein